MSWRVIRYEPEYGPPEVHVYPVGDTFPHLTSIHCWCDPDIEDGHDRLATITHNAKDGREDYESGVRRYQ